MSQGPNQLNVTNLPTKALKPYPNNARKHPKKQLKSIAESIEAFGFLVPIGIDENNVILSGHGRWEASKLLGLEQVPCVRHKGLTETQKRAYVLADNKIPEGATWNKPLLRLELNAISLPNIEIDAYPTGFTMPEIEALFQEPPQKQAKAKKPKEEQDDLPALMSFSQRCQLGDLWQVGQHRLMCGDASDRATLFKLMGGDKAALSLSEIMLPEDCDEGEKISFLRAIQDNIAAVARDGSIHFLFIDWTDFAVFQQAGQSSLGSLRDFIVWDQKDHEETHGLYKSGHKIVLAFQHGSENKAHEEAIHSRCRQRSNIWSYRQVAAASVKCNDLDLCHDSDLRHGLDLGHGLDLAIDVKPISMIADAICDGSNEGDIILDPAGWSGSSLIAAHRTARIAYICEWDTSYCDLILARAENATGNKAKLLSRKAESQIQFACNGGAA